MTPTTIRHTVAFRMHHQAGSSEERQFLADGLIILSAIPGVKKFEVLRQVGQKNPYTFGFSMEFESEADYDAYNHHPAHIGFVEDRWTSEVAEFLEIDYRGW